MKASELAQALKQAKSSIAKDIVHTGHPHPVDLQNALRYAAELKALGITPIHTGGELWRAAREVRECEACMVEDWRSGRMVFADPDDAYYWRKAHDAMLSVLSVYESAIDNRITQLPDLRPGNYYVSCKDGSRHALLAGPFPSHQQALDLVDQCSSLAWKLDTKAPWYSYGTCRMPDDYTTPGKLNEYLN